MIRSAFACLLFPVAVFAGDLTIDNPMVPLAPPSAMAHVAYMTITNAGDTSKSLMGVSAEGYAIAHIHKTEVDNDLVSMSPVDLIEIAPGQSVAFEAGGLHVMLMQPDAPLAAGDTVGLTLEFADGSTEAVKAMVMKLKHRHVGQDHGSHGHGSHGHDS